MRDRRIDSIVIVKEDGEVAIVKRLKKYRIIC